MNHKPSIQLRKADINDCRLIWEWANDPVVRQSAFSSETIAWEVHQQWFNRKINDPNCFIFIGLDDNQAPVGQVRFDLSSENEFEVDVSIAQNKRGLGYGANLIAQGVEKLVIATKVKVVHALVKEENLSSIHAFKKAGFVVDSKEIVRQIPIIRLIWRENG